MLEVLSTASLRCGEWENFKRLARKMQRRVSTLVHLCMFEEFVSQERLDDGMACGPCTAGTHIANMAEDFLQQSALTTDLETQMQTKESHIF